jgi:hypothetical protein
MPKVKGEASAVNSCPASMNAPDLISNGRRRVVKNCNAYRIVLLSRRRKNELPGKEEKNGETNEEKKNEALLSSRLGSDALHAALRWLVPGIALGG